METVAVSRSFRRAQYGRAAMSGSRDLAVAKFAFSEKFAIFLGYFEKKFHKSTDNFFGKIFAGSLSAFCIKSHEKVTREARPKTRWTR